MPRPQPDSELPPLQRHAEPKPQRRNRRAVIIRELNDWRELEECGVPVRGRCERERRAVERHTRSGTRGAAAERSAEPAWLLPWPKPMSVSTWKYSRPLHVRSEGPALSTGGSVGDRLAAPTR